jgi:DNA-binding FadR family transcriptional regulator
MFRTPDALIRNVHSQVADRVGISIVRGDVGIGQTLPSEMQICEMMDVSRTVVLEAIATGNVEAARETTNLLLKNSVDDLTRIRGREFAAKAPATPMRERG